MAPEPLPGPPGILTLEMPFQPHELSTIAAISRISPCQLRWRITRSAPRMGRRFGLLLARSALVAGLTGHLQSQPVTRARPRSVRARTPAPVSGRPAPGPRSAPAVAVEWELAAEPGRSRALSGS